MYTRGVQEPSITLQRPEVGERPVRRPDGLALLEVCVARKDDIQGVPGPVQQRTLNTAQSGPKSIRRFHAPEPEVRRHLVVSGSSGMERPRHVSYLLVQESLDE